MTGTHANHTAGYATRLAPLAALLACIGTALPPAVRAADTGPRESALHVGGRVDLTSDNRARGISTSASRPTAKLTAELLHNAGLFAELELTRVSKVQYPRGRGLGLQATAGYRFGDAETWRFEIGAQHSRFPGARLPGLSGSDFTLIRDPDTGQIVDIQPAALDVSPTTNELFAGASRGPLEARYFHTVSRTFFGINGATVCPSIPDPLRALACLEAGPQNSRGSQYLELSYTHRLSRSSALVARIGHQHVAAWRSFDTSSYALEARIRWRTVEASATLTGARPREKGVYDVKLANGSVRDAGRTALVLTAGYSF
ncbi:MAG: hypothetical protein ACK5UM_16510 [Pseudomonadota bacterium]|jgi:hypothetical protein|nr:hypothetical protein [Rubrivivax sp.]MCA3259972.1 hypothetical protein [Rubrivivax sp.]MCZ8029674.1 hypothetical protein [Rubrivivax sp.]